MPRLAPEDLETPYATHDLLLPNQAQHRPCHLAELKVNLPSYSSGKARRNLVDEIHCYTSATFYKYCYSFKKTPYRMITAGLEKYSGMSIYSHLKRVSLESY